MALFRSHRASLSKYTTFPYPFRYHVFLSFRGENTRKNFTDHLYTALVNAGFHTFRDDPELERGENIKEKLENAIRQSRSSVIVFSRDYTSSRWCLDELVMILQRKRTCDHVVLPVFYDVNPSQLRKQAETLSNVPKYHENQSSEKLSGWRAALREVADLAGMVLENEADGHESRFIQNIVREIQYKLGHVPLSHVQEVLQEKLLYVNPVLDDAEGKQMRFQTSVKPWLHKLKEAVYDAEDLLQEIKTEALRQKIEHEYGSSTSKVQELISTPPSHAFDSALIYPKVEEVLNRLDSIMEQRRDVLGMEASAGYMVSQTIPSTSLVEDCVYGRDEEKERFIKLLLSDDETGKKIGVLPIVGMGGIGKTTLAQFLYNDIRVKQHFGLQAWVCVSKEFDVLRISQHIFESLTSEVCRIANLDLLQSKLQETLMGKRFFFVLDDIWNKNYNQLEFLRRPFQSGAHGSKIIVTTRDENVARMMGSLEAHHLMPMSKEDGWSLFKKHAFNNVGVGAHSHLEEIGRQIVQKCNGLPLAIKSLGGLLCSKPSSEEWESILDSDMWELTQSDILPSLWLSYLYLPLHLKRCFSYCSIFPKNYRLKKLELVLLWKAQGLLQPKKKKMIEEVGEEYFNDLISRSFFQRSSSSAHFIMHDLIIDLADFVSGEFSVRWENSESPNILRKTRHFSYMEKHGDSFAKLEAIRQAKYLRTLLPVPEYACYLGTFNKEKFREVLYEVLPKLQCLRVLNLSLYNIVELPDSINNLKHLRHLDMSETTIRKLPDTICTLYNLQALLLRKCRSLSTLPTNLTRLTSLNHLDIKDTKIERMPPRTGDFKDLQILPEFVLDKYTQGHNALELKKLQNLRGTLTISGLWNVVNGSALVANIVRDKKFVTELNLNWKYMSEKGDMVEGKEVLEKLQPHQNLERLTITGYGGKIFPGWSEYYSSSALVYLKLEDCENCISLPPLGQLPFLTELYIDGLHGVESIGSEFYYGNNTSCVNKLPFRSLRSLRFDDMSGWQEWSHVGVDDSEHGVFPNLRELRVSDCPSLTGRLAVDRFPVLEELQLSCTNLSLITSSHECPKILSLTRLKLSRCRYVESFPHAPNLTEISIFDCWDLSSWPEQLQSLLPSIQYFSVSDFEELPSKVKSIGIKRSTRLDAKSMQNLENGLRTLTSLDRLSINFSKFKEVNSFLEEGLFPSTLTHLTIYHLNVDTMYGTNWFGHLHCLEILKISCCTVLRYLPDSGLPSSLQILEIRYCYELQRLPQSGLPTSLKILDIQYCPSLQCLPESGLPASLSELCIIGCEFLEKLCQRGRGKYWPKIAHIPHISIPGSP